MAKFTKPIVLLSAQIKVRMGLLQAILDYLRPFLQDLWFIFQTISSLKLECEKLASEKIEIQRHYVMVSWSEKFAWSLADFYPCYYLTQIARNVRS